MSLIRRLIAVGLVVIACAPSSGVAQETTSDSLMRRVASLERQIAELEQRLRVLEAQLAARPAAASSPASANWRDVANWRQLRRGMRENQVRELLGDPTRVDAGGSFTTWRWTGGGAFAEVRFYEGRLDGWTEPVR